MADTKKNLQEAFAGESQASQRYIAFSRKAGQEGHNQVAKLFRAAAMSEKIHAQNHLRAAKLIGSTLENLKVAAEGEAEEFNSMYPGFIETARAEGEEQARNSFDMACRVEQIHHELYSAAIETIENGESVDEEDIYLCPVCGNTIAGDAPGKCPICATPSEKFEMVQ